MVKYSVCFLAALLLLGCSAQKSVSKTTSKDLQIKRDSLYNIRSQALEHFIDGAVSEVKGEHANAILDYQDALQFEPKAGVYYALAKNYLALNKLPHALRDAKKAVELDTTQIDYYNLLADIYSTADQHDSAAVVLNHVIKLDSLNISAYYRLARIYEHNKPLRAIKIYDKLTSIIGPDWNVLIHVAELHEKLGEYKKAASTIKRLLKLDPSNTGLEKLLVQYYLKAKMYDKAMDTINDVLQMNPDDLDAREKKAQIYIAKNDWKKASTQYDYLMKQPKISLLLKLKIGASYFNQALKDSSLIPITKKFFQTINQDTVVWQTKMYLGAIAIQQKQDSLAIKEFKEATNLASWNVEPWVRLGGLYFDNHKYPEAIKVMKEAYKSFPEDFRINLIYGLALSQNGNNKSAKQYLKKAVELNSSDITALSAYGYTLSQLKENDEAVKYLKKALQLSPKDVNLLGTLGLIYDSQEKWAQCDSVYEKALSIDSTNALVNNNYAYSLSERGIRLDSALKMAKKAISEEPKNSSYLDTIGWVYFKLGNYAKAKDFVNEAIKYGGEESTMLEHLGDIEFKLGQKDKAKELWQKAYKKDSTNKKLKKKIEKGEI